MSELMDNRNPFFICAKYLLAANSRYLFSRKSWQTFIEDIEISSGKKLIPANACPSALTFLLAYKFSLLSPYLF